MSRESYCCPFCGQRMRPWRCTEGAYVYACTNCGASGPECSTKLAARQQWVKVFLPNGRMRLTVRT